MKKKVLSLALVVALIAIVVSGSLAYFTADDKVTNSFTIGSVKVEVVEDFEEPENMVPVVTVSESDPNYINKDARAKNTGNNAAYVQMYVAIPKAMDDVGAFVVVDTDNGDWSARTLAGTATFGTDTYNVYVYRYMEKLEAGAESSDVITAAYLAPELDYRDGKFVMNGVTIEDYIPGTSIDIYVAAQAIQADGFDGYTSALDTFTTHPWAN